MSRGSLIILSAPSGAGKSSILRKLLALVPRLTFSVSHTTRPPRPGEKEGVDYFFVDHAYFQEMIGIKYFLEWANVHGNLYGTSIAAVTEHLAMGTDVLLDIDTQGALQIKRSGLEERMVLVFVAPPSWETLAQRLIDRKTDSPKTIALRLKNARAEMQRLDEYEYVIENDRLDEAVDTLRAIIIAERSKRRCTASGAPLQILART